MLALLCFCLVTHVLAHFLLCQLSSLQLQFADIMHLCGAVHLCNVPCAIVVFNVLRESLDTYGLP